MTIIDHIIGLVESRIELAKFSAKEEISKIAAKLIIVVIISIVGFFLWFYLSLALGFYLNDVIESRYAGVLIVAGIHLIILLILYFFHDKLGLKHAIRAGLDKTINENDDNEDESGA